MKYLHATGVLDLIFCSVLKFCFLRTFCLIFHSITEQKRFSVDTHASLDMEPNSASFLKKISILCRGQGLAMNSFKNLPSC